jgi:hypothetical protein
MYIYFEQQWPHIKTKKAQRVLLAQEVFDASENKQDNTIKVFYCQRMCLVHQSQRMRIQFWSGATKKVAAHELMFVSNTE